MVHFTRKGDNALKFKLYGGPEVILENRALSYLQDELWYQQGLQSYTL